MGMSVFVGVFMPVVVSVVLLMFVMMSTNPGRALAGQSASAFFTH
jgi:hypothetical protein